ncbi:hypothetical protein BOTCAL_0029g00360 [Botryotinia calthae]|uniref:Uncharacterized protein n=1 Tax=Botryotinia calthae TaxID=38488 RepID=A0A4Y8DDH8_9HELO|nr:hypothetical protein BOTCAL_0029g00360 [Botryotinia calthae]
MYDVSHSEANLPELQLLPLPPPQWDDGKKKYKGLETGKLKYIIMDEATAKVFFTNQDGPGWQELLMRALVEIRITRTPRIQAPPWGPSVLAIPMPSKRNHMIVMSAFIRSTGN